MIIATTTYWFLMALILALLEIEIESKYGWAEKLPTWYDTTSVPGRLYTLFMAGKPLTGYHLFLQIFCLQIVFLPYVHNTPVTIPNLLNSFALFMVWAAVWDFLWFVMNPEYGFKKFRKETVWWFAKSKWIFGLFPMDYLNGLLISLLCTGLASWLKGEIFIFSDHIAMVIGWVALTIATVIIAPSYHRWRVKMNSKDDRDKLDIFHK